MISALICMQLVFIAMSIADLSCQPLVLVKCLLKLLLVAPLLIELLLDVLSFTLGFVDFVEMMLCRRVDATLAIFIFM